MIIGHGTADRSKIRKLIEKEGVKIYFIGIGGISVSSLARMSLERSMRVFGSDIKKSAVTVALESLGVRIRYVSGGANIAEIMPDIVVYSLSISEENAEYVAAKRLGIPAISRAEYLGILMESYSMRIGVSGSHGKSTVTAMLGSVLSYADLSPSILCGAEISDSFGYISGEKNYLVYEACEYGDSFLRFSPSVQIMLNLDFDHPDYFKDMDALKRSFLASANGASELVILNKDDAALASLIPYIKVKTLTFSSGEDADFSYSIVSCKNGRFTFDLSGSFGEERYTLGIPGDFNIPNAVSAVITARWLGIPYDMLNNAIEEFHGIKRRLEPLGKRGNVAVYYDYAHHPKEIESTFRALSDMGYRSVAAVFSPHTYSRTKALFFDFAVALSKFSAVYITDIYGARESAIVGVSAYSLVKAVRESGGKASLLTDIDMMSSFVYGNYDCLVLMGAGDLDIIKRKIEEL